MSADIKKSYFGKGVFPAKYAFTLLNPFRRLFLSPNSLIKFLELNDDMSVLEVGPGPGFFSLHIARYLKRGKLFLMDIQQEMLDYAKRRLFRKGIVNTEYKLSDGNSIDYDSNVFDRIFLVTVLGEITNQKLYLNEFYRILKSGGLLSISETWGDPDKLTLQQIDELIKDTGFKFYKKYGNDSNYTVIYRKI